jgi:hypothetical protein
VVHWSREHPDPSITNTKLIAISPAQTASKPWL